MKTQLLCFAKHRAKTSWLLHVLNLPPLNQAHKNLVLKVVDLRNGYVHYKWQLKGDGPSQTDLELDKCLASVEKTIAYLKHYERRALFSNKKSVIKHFIENKKRSAT